MQLRLPLQQLDKTATVEVEVSVHVTYLPTGIGQGPQLAIAWDPGDANLFPSFKGTIVATPRKGEGCMLTISGTYNAPHGVVGALFDAAVGIRVAHSTLEELLADLRKAIESDYHERMRWT